MFFKVSARIYRLILGIYPAALLIHYGEEMQDVFEQQLLGAWKHSGISGVVQVWHCVMTEVILDIVRYRLIRMLFGIPMISIVSAFVLFAFVAWAGGFATSACAYATLR